MTAEAFSRKQPHDRRLSQHALFSTSFRACISAGLPQTQGEENHKEGLKAIKHQQKFKVVLQVAHVLAWLSSCQLTCETSRCFSCGKACSLLSHFTCIDLATDANRILAACSLRCHLNASPKKPVSPRKQPHA